MRQQFQVRDCVQHHALEKFSGAQCNGSALRKEYLSTCSVLIKLGCIQVREILLIDSLID